MRSLLWVMVLIFGLAASTQAAPRTFTDDQGKTTNAELSGVDGNDVILRRGGVAIRWPLARLSQADQAYVKEWQKNPPTTPKLLVRLWERKGISPVGIMSVSEDSRPDLPNIPGVIEVEKKDAFHYFDVDISNPSSTQANQLTLAYQLYVITDPGEIVTETGTQVLPSINANKVVKASTHAISTTRTKTTSLSVNANRQGGVSTSENRKRESERFGGGWVRVYSHDGQVVGEEKSMLPQFEGNAWLGATLAGNPSVSNLGEFDAFVAEFQSRLNQVQEILKTLPPPPSPPALPPPPPGLPGG